MTAAAGPADRAGSTAVARAGSAEAGAPAATPATVAAVAAPSVAVPPATARPAAVPPVGSPLAAPRLAPPLIAVPRANAAAAAARPVAVLRTTAAYADAARRAHSDRRSVGVVPTMGALHAGHRSLVERAVRECDVVFVTIFVNPTQFGEAADLASYPRTLAEDLEVASRAGAAYVFAPPDSEIYPDGLGTEPLPPGVGELARPLEGASRPGHFDGVATVVPKLLAPAGPCRAYFGEKDYQQLVVVRRLVGALGLPVEVVPCETVREPDGLALSSRNVRLGPDERLAARSLSQALRAGARALASGAGAGQVEAAMRAVLEAEPLVESDYAVLVRADTLCPPEAIDASTPLRLLVAARVGEVRLIDNLDPRRPLPGSPPAVDHDGAAW